MDGRFNCVPNFVWIKVAGFHSALAKREDSTANPPSWISFRAAREVVVPHMTKKIPNGSTAHPCALRALTIIADGFTVFQSSYFGNFEGNWCKLWVHSLN
jgi:hypothetical protein